MSQLLREVETLSFKIGLSGTYWGKFPQYSILIDDTIISQNSVTEPSIIEFQYTLTNNSDFTLSIRLNNKEDADTELNESNTEIVKDMLLNIDSIEIDGIELEILKWSKSIFVPDDKNRPILDNCVNLGWNGTYKLTISSPFYLWLLENM